MTKPQNRSQTATAQQPGLTQLDKFKAAARELGTDDDPERFKERVRKVGGAKVKFETNKPGTIFSD